MAILPLLTLDPLPAQISQVQNCGVSCYYANPLKQNRVVILKTQDLNLGSASNENCLRVLRQASQSEPTISDDIITP